MEISENDAEQKRASMSARAMWFIALLLGVGVMSLATAALPGQARPLFVLPLVFGFATAGQSVAWARSLSLPCSVWPWLITVALALGGYGQVVASGFRQYEAQVAKKSGSDGQALIAIQMLQGSSPEHRELADRMREDLAKRTVSWQGFLTQRYAAIAGLSGRKAEVAFLAELLLVIGGVGLGRRMLDARRQSCQSELV